MNLGKNHSATGKSLEDVHGTVDTTARGTGWRRFLAFIGPAYLVSVGYMDPGNWATDLAAGSGFGYTLIWVLLMSNLMAILLQSHSARLGIVRGQDLAQASRTSYPPIINIPLYIFAEIAIAACDLAEVLGLAIGLNLLFGMPLLWGVSIAVLDCILLLLILNFGIRKMEAFIISMVFIMGASFFVEVFMAKPDVGGIVNGFAPSIPSETALYIAIGIIGATVMPHNLYLHSALVQTRKFENTNEGKKRALKFNLIDSTLALNLAFFVNASILILGAAVFFSNGLTEVADIQDAHKLLEPLLGSSLAPILFAVALIASGQSSTITGTLAGQIIMEGYLNLRITPWLRRLITRLLAVVPAFLVIWLKGEEETGELLILSQVILSMQLGFAIIPLIHFVSDKKKMGSFAIGTITRIASWVTAIIIVSLNIKLVYATISDLLDKPNNWWVYAFVIPVALYGIVLLLYIAIKPFVSSKTYEPKLINTIEPNMEFAIKGAFKKIAVTLDFSSQDTPTIAQAIAAGGKEAEYILIHIVESAGAITFGKDTGDMESRKDFQQLKAYVDELMRLGYKAKAELGYGRPTRAIPEIVKQQEADMLVMGAHGHRGLKDLILGETINTVRHRISIPLLAVK
ncbi:MAG TPA: Nramp family divalent metal transporter [Chitinophagales bacterium]|nr:Nramp family divalent metal transporter [Chitinophagales bacterium]HMU68358.1 Nramp family divalent metal transporter [Chitinophagales bacterium]HMZ89662.1 Nramp family divalent metal transporter [Chitinophagales bacterium]HNI53106.1 Nramp family divalent metal transporter [Chitinophagales bacterium]HNJ90384.1 Nramp family divalent metal transporter [Chitinophagales bacterium]